MEKVLKYANETSTRVTFVLLILDKRNCYIFLEMILLVEIQLVTDTYLSFRHSTCISIVLSVLRYNHEKICISRGE